MRYRVTAPYATLRMLDEATGKATLHGYYTGAILPESTQQADIDDHIAKGMVEAVEEPEPAKPAKATKAAG